MYEKMLVQSYVRNKQVVEKLMIIFKNNPICKHILNPWTPEPPLNLSEFTSR